MDTARGPATATLTLDVVGLPCPVPVLKARKALAGLAPGAVIEVLANDPAAVEDFAALCASGGHRLIAQELSGDGIQRFLIEKAKSGA